MANPGLGQSGPNASGAKSGKTSSVGGVVSSLKRFASIENIKPHFDLSVSRRHTPAAEKGRGAKAGTMADRRFPVVLNNTESRPARTRPLSRPLIVPEESLPANRPHNRPLSMPFIVSEEGLPTNKPHGRPLSRPLIVPEESFAQIPSEPVSVREEIGSETTHSKIHPLIPPPVLRDPSSATVAPQRNGNMDSGASMVDLSSRRVSATSSRRGSTTSSRRGSTSTVLTGEGRSTVRRTRSTLSLFPTTLEEAAEMESAEAATIKPPPQAKIDETKSQVSAVAGMPSPNIDSVDPTPTSSVTTFAAPTSANVRQKDISKQASSSTLNLSNKIVDYITMQPNNPPAAEVELTPLSALIAQSRRDLQLLRAIKAAAEAAEAAAAATPPPPKGFIGMSKSLLKTISIDNLRKTFRSSSNEDTPPVAEETEMEEQKKEVDFEKMELNLDRFEDLYEAFLELSDANGEQNEEVHLLAVVAKKGEMVRGVRQAGGIKLTEKVVPQPAEPAQPAQPARSDCGM